MHVSEVQVGSSEWWAEVAGGGEHSPSSPWRPLYGSRGQEGHKGRRQVVSSL